MRNAEHAFSTSDSSAVVGHYSRTVDGHRSSYLAFAIGLLGGHRVSESELFRHKGPVLFLMVEDHFGLYVLASLFRALLGRRTVGLLFRPGPAVHGQSLRLKVKRYALRLLRKVPAVRTLSIVPMPLAPQIETIADGWIHDFQLWDLSDTQRQSIADLRSEHPTGNPDAMALLTASRTHACGRPLLVALGMQNRAKGIQLLAASMRQGGTTGWAVMVAGRFDAASASTKTELESMGALVMDRHLSDHEIEAAYAAATAVWCLYDPSYDQASGILGRAVQLGLPAVVRRGSFSDALCRQEMMPHVAAQGGADLASALAVLPKQEADAGLALSKRLLTENAKRLRYALDLASARHP